MKLKLNENVLRVALILFSVMFGLLSISLIALGIAYIEELKWPRRYVALDFMELPHMLILLGCLSLMMAVWGCFCSKSYNRKILISFSAILFLILILELAIAVIAFINFNEHDVRRSKTAIKMTDDYQSLDKNERLYFQSVENHFYCCGITGTESNCHMDDTQINTKSGCVQAVDESIRTAALNLGFFAICLSFIQMNQILCVYLIQHHVYELL